MSENSNVYLYESVSEEMKEFAQKGGEFLQKELARIAHHPAERIALAIFGTPMGGLGISEITFMNEKGTGGSSLMYCDLDNFMIIAAAREVLVYHQTVSEADEDDLAERIEMLEYLWSRKLVPDEKEIQKTPATPKPVKSIVSLPKGTIEKMQAEGKLTEVPVRKIPRKRT
jgi:hypothetical protein